MSNRLALVAPAVAAALHGAIKALALAATLMTLALAPAFAEGVTTDEAVTYTGTLGEQAIVVELTGFKEGPLLGRYSDLSNGIDIPLHALRADGDEIVLAEEAPCTPALCLRVDRNLVLAPPLGGQFELHYSEDRATLTGIWRASNYTDAELPVELTRFGQRAFRRGHAPGHQSLTWGLDGYGPVTRETTPYHYAKMLVALTVGPLQTMNGATYRQMSDLRTKFASPRIVSLPGGGSVEPINAALDQQLRWVSNVIGFDCLSMTYLSNILMYDPAGPGAASLGGVDKDVTSIEYISDSVMTIRKKGAYSCGGEAYRHDFDGRINFYVQGGTELDLGQIFTGWDGTTKRPPKELIDWVIEAYGKAEDYDADRAALCITNDKLTEALHVSFAQGDVAVFLLDNIVDPACDGVIVSVPLEEIKNLLTGNASVYFPSLR